jgi:transmembrane sensor
MKNGTSLSKEQREALPASARAEAAAWVARLHSSDRTQEHESGFRRWIEADVAHAAAFEIATEAWELGGSIPANRFPRIAHPGPAPRSFVSAQRFTIAAGLCAAAIGAVFYINRDNSAVTTGVGEQRMLTLEDGSRIYLNTDTKLTVHFDKDRRLVRLAEGEALFDVAKNPARPFIVDVGEKQVRAVGTEFVIRRDPHELAVTLVEGTVRVTDQESRDATDSSGPAEQQPKILTAGQRLTFADNKPPTLDQPQLDNVTAWRRGEVVLDKTRLEDATEEMNRYSQVKLVVDNPETANIRLSGIFRAGDSARFADAVAETYHLQVDHQRARIIISGVRRE